MKSPLTIPATLAFTLLGAACGKATPSPIDAAVAVTDAACVPCIYEAGDNGDCPPPTCATGPNSDTCPEGCIPAPVG